MIQEVKGEYVNYDYEKKMIISVDNITGLMYNRRYLKRSERSVLCQKESVSVGICV